MKRMLTLAAVPALILAAGTGYAASPGGEPTDRAEMQSFMSADMSIGDAVSKAEAQGGKAVSAEWTLEQDGSAGYEVEIADASGGTKTLFVNASDGSVMAAPESNDDHEGSDGDGEEQND
ncbi:PepSY domain-containing protein [Oceaniglobus roseus]|uniref:PepSY domain-containing protein n=1 Tax=Oceaniglobus roseus TaxID=1737570 RepID=UPI000C7F57A6|nr:PepSY domain-containing protein [Kandeliimicrobium roseum]